MRIQWSDIVPVIDQHLCEDLSPDLAFVFWIHGTFRGAFELTGEILRVGQRSDHPANRKKRKSK